MKSYLAMIFIIAVSTISVPAQNLTQMVASPSINPDKSNGLNISFSLVKNSEETVKSNNESQPAGEADAEINDAPLISIDVVGMRTPLFKYEPPPKQKKNLFERAADINRDAIMQRQRFLLTGQAIEIDQDRIYYRRDNFSYTKGIVLLKFMNGKMDLGIFRSNFSPATTLVGGRLGVDYSQGDSNALLFRNGSRVFFALRMRIPTP